MRKQHFLLLLFLYLLSIECSFSKTFADVIKVDIEVLNGADEIKFSSKAPLNASIFLRDNKLWFVFDKLANLTLSSIDYNKTDILKNFQQLKTEGNVTIAYIEIKNPADFEITSRKQQENWIVRIAPYENTVLASEIPLKRNITKQFVEMSNTVNIELYSKKSQIISFTDPFFGDTITTIPESIASKNSQYKFIDFTIIESFAGIVVKPLNDSIKFNLNDKSLLISSSSYLNISTDKSVGGLSTQLLFDGLNISNSNVILDLKPYKVIPGNFNRNINAINREINNSYDNEIKGDNFLNLVMFFLANKWYVEAKSIIELVYRNSDIIARDYRVRLVIAVIYLMCDDINEAYDMINSIDLNYVPMQKKSEVRFWQNFCEIAYKVQSKEYSKEGYLNSTFKRVTNKIKKHKKNFLSKYSEDIFRFICFKTMDFGMKINNNNEAQEVADALAINELQDKDLRLLNYYYGKIFAALGDEKSASAKFSDCASNISDQYTYSHCRFELIKLMHKNLEISQIQYINELQGLSTIWRGDNFEKDVLETLANTYYNMQDIPNAMRVWQTISNSYSQFYDGFLSVTKASKIFIDYLKTSNDSSLSKLAFFYEFKDLIPLGYEGDEVILQTTLYMIDLNLLDQAVKVMEYQIKNRLIGFIKEKIINDLVMVYENMNDWEMSEKLIDQFTDFPFNTTNPIIAERKYLYIKSIIGSGQYMDAIALLYGDNSEQADELRSTAFFNLKNWSEFNDNSEPYLYSIRYNKNRVLTKEDSEKLLKQSIAYFNNNQMDLLQNMFLDFKPKFHKFQKGQKNAERNKLFYQIANELQSPNFASNKAKNESVKNLIKQLVEVA